MAGPREPIRFGPVVLEALYSVGPILEGIGLNITAWSYEDPLGVSLIGCPSSVPDPWALVDHLHGALDELSRRGRRDASPPSTEDTAAVLAPHRAWIASGPPHRPDPGHPIREQS